MVCLLLELDECCYSYASVPKNNTFCVPDGGLVFLNYIIINPHDNFTDLMVTWFRRTIKDNSISRIPRIVTEGYSTTFNLATAPNELSTSNQCSHALYRDSTSLTIDNFTCDKDGYYWCQLSINNTLVQPSHHIHLYTGECSLTHQYFRLANSSESQCVKYVSLNTHAFTTITIDSHNMITSVRETPYKSYYMTFSVTPSSGAPTRSSSVTQQEKRSERLTIYVAGSLGALVAVFGVLVIVLSIFYLCKFRSGETSKSQLIILYSALYLMHVCA